MLCPQCHGTRRTMVKTIDGLSGELRYFDVPCAYCSGQGVVSCCEGSERHGQLIWPERKQGANQ